MRWTPGASGCWRWSSGPSGCSTARATSTSCGANSSARRQHVGGGDLADQRLAGEVEGEVLQEHRVVAAGCAFADAEGARPAGDALADGAEADDQPMAVREVPEAQPGPLPGALRGATLGAALIVIEHAPEDVVGHADRLAVAGGEAHAALDELAEHRM